MLSPMPLLAQVITATLSVIFDIASLFFSLLKNLLFTAGYLHFKNQLQLDRYAEWKARYPVHQAAGVHAFSEDVLQQL